MKKKNKLKNLLNFLTFHLELLQMHKNNLFIAEFNL